MLILQQGWPQAGALLAEIAEVVAQAGGRPCYYPGCEKRMADFVAKGVTPHLLRRAEGAPCLILHDVDDENEAALSQTEAFAPVLSIKRIAGEDSEIYLRQAIAWANATLYGSLGANIVIHPATRRQMGANGSRR